MRLLPGIHRMGIAVALGLAAVLVLVGIAEAASRVPSRAGTKYIEVLQPDGTYEPVFIKGMNLSVALPGKHPSEFPRDEELYRRWLKEIADMNCNSIRVYTLHPPDLYNALYYHNTTYPDQPIWLIQGVWATPPPGGDFLDETYLEEVYLNMRNAVNVVHGNANFDERPGWTGGRYTKDVSKWMLAWLLGREWEPDDIQGFHKLHPEFTHYEGKLVSCKNGQPIECWFAKILDFCVTYEDERYHVQRPVTFSSWPPTDPLSHMSESNLEDEGDIAGIEAEGRIEVFSNDAVNLTSKNLSAEPEFKAGLYASYHVYPYWPDFLDNEPEYGEANDRFGPSKYIGYLNSLKAYYDDRPLLIAEYGLPNGPMSAHEHTQGWSHGGHSEAEVATEVPRLTYDIYDSGCAGAIVFAWIDEWFKKEWLWAEFYDPYMDRRTWFNFYSPEQNFGMVAIHPGEGGPNCTLSGNSQEWENAFEREGESVAMVEGAPVVSSVKMMHDEGWLFFRIKLDNFDDWEFREHGMYLGIDILGDDRGNTAWPGPLNLYSDRGLEEVVSFTMGEARLWQTESFRFWEPYRVSYSVRPRIAEVLPHILEEEENRWIWYEPVAETNRRRVGRDGSVYEHRSVSINPLPRGSLIDGPEYNDQTAWNVDPDTGVVELRMPWILMGFAGPHQSRVMQADPETDLNSSEITEGIGVAVVISSATGEEAAAWPGLNEDGDTVLTSVAGRYSWVDWDWDEVTWHTRFKPVYFAMQKLFGGTDLKPFGGGVAPTPQPEPDIETTEPEPEPEAIDEPEEAGVADEAVEPEKDDSGKARKQ